MARSLAIFLVAVSLAIFALWIRSAWNRDSLRYDYVSSPRPASRYYNLIGSRRGSIRIIVGVTRDLPGTADVSIESDNQIASGSHWFFDWGLNPRSYMLEWGGPKKWQLALLGFGVAKHNYNDKVLANGWFTTTQPASLSTTHGFELWFPHPALIIVLLAWPTLRWRRLRRIAGRLRAGLCAQCGYDLRATPDQCPECGYEPDTLR